ncbi:MAG: hypothetical protein A2168_08955 [Planctomycetes bacterium RBG_13_50_24]|nr:MAG: hypothetical protein A2168_08955 [Planctomycetes bacterium RBG_13_50_24]
MVKISSIGSFFEEHVEKIILVIVGIFCAVFLITRVILSPNKVSYDDRNFSPSAIDNYVYEQAQLLRQKLNEPPNQLDPYKSRVNDFLALLDSSIRNVDTTLWPVAPYELGDEAGVAGIYNLPRIGEVNDVAVEHIRAVAYVPINEVTPENPYDKAGNEPNDIDLVTVEAKFDVKQLYDKFKECFVEDVEQQWADPCLARPIFTAVNLQRQELNSDGTWSDWRNVPRTKTEHYQKMFQIIEDIQDLPPGGLKVQMLQFDNKQVQIDLLQPQTYQIASAKEEWFPPVLHRKFLDLQRKDTMEEKRDAREAEKEERDKGQDDKRNRRADSRTGATGRTSRTGSGYSSSGGAGVDLYGGGSTNTRSRDRSRDRQSTTTGRLNEGGRSTTDRRRSSRNRTGTTDPMMDTLSLYGNERLGDVRGGTLRRAPSVNDVYYDYDEIAFDRLTDFSKLREPMVFWHHDDTLEPKKTYRYRIRLGVFNPLAGTNQLNEQDISQKNKVILWSDFSDVTEPVEIPGRSYFFARDIQEAAKIITVTVCQYVLGHWYSEDFKVSKGEAIGDVIENEIEEKKPQRGRSAVGRSAVGRGAGDSRADYLVDRYATLARPEEKTNIPEEIDYSTGAVMVDTMSINDWWGDSTRRTRNYYDMLYSFDGINIEHMPVGTTYWTKDMQTVFNDIAQLEREPQEPFKDFNATRRRSVRPGQGGAYEGMEMYEEMYNQQQMMEGAGGARGRY